MPSLDLFHNTVKNALQKEGWIITHDPFYLSIGGGEMYIYLGAEQLIGAEKEGKKIAVEIKSFIGASAISEFHLALGQFLNYRLALTTIDPVRILYLAVPSDTYDSFFSLKFVQMSLAQYQINLIVYDPVSEVIIKWQQ